MKELYIWVVSHDSEAQGALAQILWQQGWQIVHDNPDNADAMFIGGRWQDSRTCLVNKGYFSTKFPNKPIFFTTPEARDYFRKERERRALEDFQTTRQGEL